MTKHTMPDWADPETGTSEQPESYLRMTDESGEVYLISNLRGREAQTTTTKIQNEVKKLGLHIELRRDVRPVKKWPR